MPDPRRPVIAGVAQESWRTPGAPDPIAMCAHVVDAAAADAGAGAALLRRAGLLGVVDIASRRWGDPGALVAARLGISPRRTVRTAIGGDGPQVLIADVAARIAAGELDAGIVCSAEGLATAARLLRAGGEPDWPPEDAGGAQAPVLGTERAPATEAEAAAGLIAPILAYPLLESVLWARAGGTIEAHRERLGVLWARLSRVAADNPHAWSREPRTAQEIARPGPGNRLVTAPYTKLLNANIQTDQAAAVILCSAEVARELGIPRERWVHPLGAAKAHDRWFITERHDLGASPAVRHAARAALGAAGAALDDVGHLDVYSCFPSAVQIAATELGYDPWLDPRPPTVTGGLTFAGGPGNGYVTHAIATLVGRLREDPDGLGLATAVGWYLTKHAVGVYGARDPTTPFRAAGVQAEVDAGPHRTVATGYAGLAAGEASSVVYDREGRPAAGTVTALLDDGRRVLGATHDAGALEVLAATPVAGVPLRFDGDGRYTPA